MVKSLLFRAVLLLVALIPVVVSAQTLDEYYLTRLAPQASGAHALSGVAAGPPAQADRCGTGIRHSAWLDLKKLQPDTRKVLAKVLSRPTLLGERTCTPVGGHFTIRYATAGTDALTDLTDANHNNVPDWVETVAGVFEYVYDIEVNKMGYRPPPGGSYDVYLRNLAVDSVYGYARNDSAGVTSTSYPSYIEIDKSFTSSIYGPYTPLTNLRITAAHEFHHAIQFGYNAYFDNWFAETTSTWIEDEVYDSANQLYGYVRHYLPQAATLPIDASGNGASEYGRWVFNRYLAEIQGSRSAIRSMWEELAKEPAPAASPDDGVNVPMLPVIDRVLDGNLGNNFFGFAKRMLAKDWLSHLTDISQIMEVTQANTFDVGSGNVSAPIVSLATPYTFASYKYRPVGLSGGNLVIDFPGLSAVHAVSAFRVDGTGWSEHVYSSASQSITVPAFTSDAVVYLLICNKGVGAVWNPVVVSPAFPADASVNSDGAGLDTYGVALDANRLTIPAQDSLPANPGGSAATGGSGGGCFIATAAYGSYLHPKVALLRAFRDEQLMTNAPGRLFVALYYRVSPPVAELIARHEVLRGVARLALTPLLLAVEHLRVALALFAAILLLAPAARRATRSARANSGVSLQ